MISLPVKPTTRRSGSKISPNEIAQAITGRPYLSYSEIRTFQQCPLKHKFQYIDKAEPEQLSAAMLLGSGVHAAVEQYFQAMLSGLPLPSVDQLMQSYRACWDREASRAPVQYAKGQDATTVAEMAKRMIEAFLESPLAQPQDQIIGIEETFYVPLGSDLPDLAGRVDMITYDADKGELIITDFKTARSIWSQDNAEEQAEQLLLYARGCEPIARDLEARIVLRFIVVTKTKQPKVDAISIEYDTSRLARSRAIIRQVFKAIQSGVVYPVPSPMNCAGCGYRQMCSHYHR